MSRMKAFLKLARETLTMRERDELNDALYGAKGFDYIDHILKGLGFSRGPKMGKGRYHLRRGGEPIGNAFLKGDYQGMEVIPQEASEDVEEEETIEISWDAYHSSAAIYEEWERENER